MIKKEKIVTKINKIKEIDKVGKYLKQKEEIVDFILGRRVLKAILFYLTIFSTILFLGGNSYINYKISTNINESFSKKIDEEVEYLTERNKISEIGDKAITSGKIKYYAALNNYLNAKKIERIQVAAKAETLRIESYFASGGDEYWPEEKIEYIDTNGEKTIGEKISTENLMREYYKTNIFGKKTTILNMLMLRNEKSIPEYLLKIAKETDNLRMRFVAMRSLGYLLNDYNVNKFDYEANEQLWNSKKEEYLNKAK